MKFSIAVERRGDTLVPGDPWAAEQMREIPEGKALVIEWKEQRSVRQLNLFWAGLGFAVEHFEGELAKHYPTSRKLYRSLLIELGYSDVIYRIDGSMIVIEDSISFDKMTQSDMNVFMERAKEKFEHWLGYDPFEEWIARKKRDGGYLRNYRPGIDGPADDL